MRNVLLIEPDQEILQSMAKELYTTQRFNIIQAINGSEAYQKAKNQEFDIIITDYKLPRLMGKELIRGFKENPDNVETPILFYTKDLDAAKDEASGYKHIYFLEKPKSPEELLENIEKIIITGIKNKMDFNIDVEIINPFISATLEILKEKCSVNDIDYTRPQTISKANQSDIITSVAIISEYYKGKVSTCFRGDIFLKIASAYTNSKLSELNDQAKDIATDIIQEIFDKANEIIIKKKFKLEQAIPALIDPKDFQIINNSSQHNLGVEFKSNIGNISCVINVQKAKIK